ncbi:MAG: CHAD domain-containing protein [Rubrivivax sp.]
METELKFQVPAARSAALHRAVKTRSATTVRLQAVYVDTDDQRLAAAGLALRLRKEGRRWVQTLKGRGDADAGHGLLDRLEHEVAVPTAEVDPGHPMPDPGRHAGTPAGELLRKALGTPSAELKLLYRTDVRRLLRRVRHGGATIEIAHDQGRLLTDRGNVAVDEFELELVAGPPQALVDLSQRWAARFGLWWDSRTKSERGMRLALGNEHVPAVHATPVRWRDAADAAGVGSAALQAALAQALPNASELAAGSGSPEHVHQLRVALRRLRTLLRMWAPWLADPDQARALEAAWRGPFGVLGAARDADVQALTLWPALQAAGAPDIDWPTPAGAPDAADCVRGPDFTSLMLQTLALTLPQPRVAGIDIDTDVGIGSSPAAAAAGAVATAARQALRPAWKHILRDARGFEQADIESQHRTRKRLKRLRYLLEALQPAFKPRATKRLLKAVRRALNALGELNDLQAAEAVCRELAGTDPRAWFAVGWLAARRAPATVMAAQALADLKAAPRVWLKA